MKAIRLTRRQFFKASVLGAGALALPAIGLASVASAPSHQAQAAAEQPEGPAIPQPTFNPIASNTTFGALTDISMGWDGTLWGIDAQGAPHVYDAINDAWAQHGDGIDAVVGLTDNVGNFTTAYVFQGDQVFTINLSTMQASAPQLIGNVWPNLPDSFKLGVVGASPSPYGGMGLILFNGGRYVSTDGSVPLTKLTDLAGWPQTPNWKDGVIDSVVTIDTGLSYAYLIRNGEVFAIDPSGKSTVGNPTPLTADTFTNLNVLPASWSTGINAGTRVAQITTTIDWIFKGTAVAVITTDGNQNQTAQITYVGNLVSNWPATWHPVLRHAPNGRDGNLWSVLPSAQGSWIVQHNGDSWTQLPNQADHVGVGQDNAVMIASAQRLWKFTGAFDGTGFTPVSPPSNLIQVSLGNSNSVYARDANNTVYSFNSSTNVLTPVSDVASAVHIAATNDGTLWHIQPDDANMYRLLTNSQLPTQAVNVQQSVVTQVSKIAATTFGSAHCLTLNNQNNVQAYRYDSPYVFKTSKRYNSWTTKVEPGAGLLYITDSVFVGSDSDLEWDTYIVAIDEHTGAELARTPAIRTPLNYGSPVFDPIHELVYVVVSIFNNDFDKTTPTQLLALDAHTLATVWSFTAPVGMDAAPALSGTNLVVSDRNGTLYMFDTTDALANPSAVKPAWAVNAAVNATQSHSIGTPVFADGQIFTTVWDGNATSPTNWDVQVSWVCYDVADGTLVGRAALHSTSVYSLSESPSAPVYGKMNVSTDATPQLAPAIYYSCIDTVYGVAAGNVQRSYTLQYTFNNFPDGVLSGLSYDSVQNNLWFGSWFARLYCLDVNLKPVNRTPFAPTTQPNNVILTTPVVYKDTQGGTTVYFSVMDDIDDGLVAVNSLLAFDPDNGNMASLPLGYTRINALSSAVSNGVIYAAGDDTSSTAQPSQYSQMFGVRVDNLAQATRDFIIESQLMQDPDESKGNASVSGPSGPIPPSVARYQTHLTVVDDQKAPLPNEPVKIWADVPNTAITVGRKQFTVGPDDSAFAAVSTGSDGSLVIMSDAKDVNTSALRVWAAFMDPYERILVYPDHEWHGRSTDSYDDPSADPTKPDPAKPNLSTVHTYSKDANDPSSTAPKPLFTDDEKSKGTPGNVAKAIGQMKSGLNPGGNSPASVAGALKTLHGSNAVTPYVAYTALGGTHYGPNNARAKRTATIYAPFGFVLNKPKSGGSHTYTPLSHSDARSAIDALEGTPWDPKNPNYPRASVSAATSNSPTGIRHTDNILDDFWDWLENAVDSVIQSVEQVLISVAEDIMVAIQYVIDGVTLVFKAVISAIEDVVNAIASFFLQLLKAIEDVIEALSVLFHFGEIMNTHRWMRDQINSNLQATVAVMQTQVQPAIDSFLLQGEQTIENLFSSIRQSLGINEDAQINDLSNARSTAHSAYTIGRGSIGPASGGTSQAVQCGHGAQKMKEGLPSAQQTTPSLVKAALTKGFAASPALSPDDDNALSAFWNNFLNSLDTDPGVKAAYSSLTGAINNIGQSQSGGDFFKGALNLLLTLVEDLILGMVAVTKALIDGLIGAIQALINAALELLNTPVDIPFFSWLYKLLFNEDLTILNAVTLVSAIPVTIIYRVATGNYPSQDGIAGAVAANGVQRQNSPTADVITKMQGTIGGVIALGLGVVRGVVDLAGATPPRIGTIFVLSFGLCYSAVYYPLMIPGSTAKPMQWAAWGLGAALATLGTFGVLNLKGLSEAVQARVKGLLTFLRVSLAIARFVVYIVSFVTANNTKVMSDLTFARNLFLELPPMFNWLKLLANTTANIVLTVIDVVTGVVVCALDLALVWVKSEPDPLRRRLYFPFVPHNRAVVRAEPHPLALGGATP